MKEIPLNERTVEMLKRAKSPVKIRIGRKDNVHVFYPVKELIVKPVDPRKFGIEWEEHPDVVPVHILDQKGRVVAFAFVKRQYGPHPEDAKRILPTILAMHVEREKKDDRVRRAIGTTVQIGVPVPPKNDREELLRVLEKAEEAIVHRLRLRDYNEGNVSKMEMFDNVLSPLTDDEPKKKVLIETLDRYGRLTGKDVPPDVFARVDEFDEEKVRKRIMEMRRRVMLLLKRAGAL